MATPKFIKDENIRFSPDAGLMYLIQSVTKQNSAEILGFFFDFGKAVLLKGVENMDGRSIRKDIRDYYPGTAIPFKLLVEASKWGSEAVKGGDIYVQFPDNVTYVKTADLMDMIFERAVLGTSAIPDFEQPKVKTPKLYKDLIKEVLNGQTLLDSRHSRTAGSSGETLERPSDQSQSGSNEG